MGFVSWAKWRSSSFLLDANKIFRWNGKALYSSHRLYMSELQKLLMPAIFLLPNQISMMSSIVETNVIFFTMIETLCITWGREINQYLWNRKFNEHFSSHLVKAIFSYSFLCVDINQRLTHTCWKGPESKCFKLCELRRLCCKCFSLPLQYRSSQRQSANEWISQCSNIAFFL